MTEQFVTIRETTGKFNFADPEDISTQVTVRIPEYDFDHTFKQDENWVRVGEMPWNEAIYEIATANNRLIGDREPRERLKEIHEEHHGELLEAWEEHRLANIEGKIESLREEKQSLE